MGGAFFCEQGTLVHVDRNSEKRMALQWTESHMGTSLLRNTPEPP